MSQMTKAVFLHAGAMPAHVVTEFRVDREQEVDACVRNLADRGANVSLWGVRGVGKTFLVRLVEK
jgi:MoxR-like ATPase